jgi:hypothetical protein
VPGSAREPGKVFNDPVPTRQGSDAMTEPVAPHATTSTLPTRLANGSTRSPPAPQAPQAQRGWLPTRISSMRTHRRVSRPSARLPSGHRADRPPDGTPMNTTTRPGQPGRQPTAGQRAMTTGTGIFLIAAGAVLRFALAAGSPHGLNVHIVGVILILAGVLGLLLPRLARAPRDRLRRWVRPGQPRAYDEPPTGAGQAAADDRPSAGPGPQRPRRAPAAGQRPRR